jgi:Kef-type K+ transport system membrane component KefB
MTDGLIITALLITFSMIAVRVLASLAFWGEMDMRERVLFSFSHSMPLTLLIAIATLAYQNHSITQYYYFSFILASLFEVIISIVAIKVITRMECQHLLERE